MHSGDVSYDFSPMLTLIVVAMEDSSSMYLIKCPVLLWPCTTVYVLQYLHVCNCRNIATIVAMVLGLCGAAAVLRAGYCYILQDSRSAGLAGSAVQVNA